MTRNAVRAIAAGVFLLAAAGITGLLVLGNRDGATARLDSLPPAARAAILEAARGGAVRTIEATTEAGCDAYEAEIIVGGARIELAVAADGTVLRREETDHAGGDEQFVTLDDLPPAARDTVLRVAAGADLTSLERKTKQGRPIYAAEFMADGKEVEVWVDAEGAVVSREDEEP